MKYKNLIEMLLDKSKEDRGIRFIDKHGNETSISYGDLYRNAASLLAYLQTRGVKPRDQLVFQLDNNRDFILFFWACLLGNITPVPVTVGTVPEFQLKLFNICSLLNHPYLVTSKKHMEKLERFALESNKSEMFNHIKHRGIFVEEIEPGEGSGKICMPAEADIAYIQFSSGSTGEPKGVVLTHNNLLTNINANIKGLEYPPSGIDRYLSWMPLTHDMGLIGFHLTPLTAGWGQTLMAAQLFIRYPHLWLRKMAELKSTLTVSPNFGYRYVLKHFDPLKNQDLDLSAVRIIVNGAEPISLQLCNEFISTMAPFGLRKNAMFPAYGLAEASLAVSLTSPEREVAAVHLDRDSLKIGEKVRITSGHEPNAVSFVEVGKPVQDCSVKIVNTKGCECEDLVVGEILIKGDNVTAGYYNNSEATSRVLTPDGWLRTGDLGFFNRGHLVITGRAKEVIFANGQNYYPHDLERSAEDLAGIEFEKVAACGIFNPKHQGDEIVCFVVFRKSLKEFLSLAAALKNHIMEKMALEVSHIIPVKKIPKTTSGKIQRMNLKTQYLEGKFDKVLEELEHLQQEIIPTGNRLSSKEIKRIVTESWCEVLKLEKVGENENFFDIGGTSAYALQIKGKLQTSLGKVIEDTAVFRYPTISTLTDFLSTENAEVTFLADQKQRLDLYCKERIRIQNGIKQYFNRRTGKDNDRNGLEIAVIGMSGRFPGAANIHEFWENLKNGIESIAFFSDDELIASGIESQMLENPNYVKAKGVLANIDYFDAAFFGYTPQEAATMDPQMRLFHECIWEALEDAGYTPGTTNGLIGVYAGASPNPYWDSRPLFSTKGNTFDQFTETQLLDKDFMSTRISYKLNLTGPSFTMYTACSTSLVAVDLACQGLMTGKCDIALAGGASLWLPQKNGHLYEDGMLFSRDGHNRTFDKQASGTIFSDGLGIVVLKRLGEALAHRDHIYAVIKGSAINNDGDRKIGYTAPALEGQAEVIRAAMQIAGVSSETIGYVETHGTATTLGDPIEIDALNLAWHTPGNKQKHCAIGSVKSNIGHLNAAAGVAGLIKAVLMLTHRQIPPSLHFTNTNPRIDFAATPFYVNTQLKKWEKGKYPLRAGVSSFGIGGTNFHAILEEAPEVLQDKRSSTSRDHQLILLSARTGSALQRATRNLAQYLSQHPGVNLADVAFTLQEGRKTFKYRWMSVSSGIEGAIAALLFPGGVSAIDPGKVFTAITEEKKRPLVFMFPGVGSQYVNMGRHLYEKEPVFQEEMDRCFEILNGLLDDDIEKILYPQNSLGGEERSEMINQPEIAQVVIFCIEYSLAKLVMSWGIHPYRMIGYSFGEYAAASIAGVFTLEDALTLVMARARLIRQTPGGAMLSVPVTMEELNTLVDEADNVSIAIDNGDAVIVSGTVAAINAFEEKMKRLRYMCMRVSQSRALHSIEMEPILKPFRQQVAMLALHKPQIPFVSNVTGREIDGNDVTHPEYWCRQLRETVRFATGIKELVKEPDAVFIEIGPGRDLSSMVRRYINDKPEQRVINLMRYPRQKVSDLGYLLERIGLLWLWGVKIDWTGFYSREKRKRIPLPAYPFEGKKYRIEGNPFDVSVAIGISSPEAVITKKSNISDWFYIPVWKETAPLTFTTNAVMSEEIGEAANWLVFIDPWGIGHCLGRRLQAQCQEVTVVEMGSQFRVEEEGKVDYRLNPQQKSDYVKLAREIRRKGKPPQRIVHLWSISSTREGDLTTGATAEAQVYGFCSILYLVRALREEHIIKPFQLAVVTNNMQTVSGEVYLCPEQSTVLGAVTVIHQENPAIVCRSIDIVLPECEARLKNWEDWEKQRLAEQLLGELGREFRENIVALRGNQRWIQTYEPIKIHNTANKHQFLREEGVYLVTGGLGRIGLVLAEYMARHAKARLVLTCSSTFPARERWHQWLSTHPDTDTVNCRIRKIQAIEALGGSVLALCADVADAAQMQNLISQTEKTFGRINGVIHAAGLLEEKSFRTVDRMETQQIHRHFHPKIDGLITLRSVLANQDLDFLLVMSSISAVLGGLGFAAYSAANIFMDHLVQQHNRESTIPWIGVNWDTWKIEENNQQHKSLHDRHEKLTMTVEEGVEAFTRVLSRVKAGLVVHSLGDLQARVQQWVKSKSLEKQDTSKPQDSFSLYTRDHLTSPYAAPRSAIETEIVSIWEDFFGFEKLGIHDDFIELGGDSLKAISLANKINHHLDVNVPISIFFESPTPEGIVKYIKQMEISPYSSITPTEKREYYPATIGQEKLFVLNEMKGIGMALNLVHVVNIEGPLDKQAFENAFKALIKRQECLRTSFVTKDGEILMKVHETIDFGIEYSVLHNQREDELKEIINHFATPFDLSQATLFKLKLLTGENQKHILLFNMHHIITDGYSIRILLTELTALYGGKDLPELKLQYKDFALWQKKFMKTEDFKKLENYWLKKFSKEVPLSDMPTDYTRPDIQSFEGEWIRFNLENQLVSNIEKLANDSGTTLYMIFLAVMNILLSRYTGKQDITVASPVMGRDHEELEKIIGLFINLLPMRNFPENHKTFSDFLNEVKENALEAYEHQMHPFGNLIEKLGIQKDYSRNPLNDVELVMVNTDLSSLEIEGLRFIPYEYNLETALVDIDLEVTESRDGIFFNLMYCTKLFIRKTMERFINSFKEILVTVTENRDVLLKDITISADLGEAKMVFQDDKENFGF